MTDWSRNHTTPRRDRPPSPETASRDWLVVRMRRNESRASGHEERRGSPRGSVLCTLVPVDTELRITPLAISLLSALTHGQAGGDGIVFGPLGPDVGVSHVVELPQ
jgi:hypothetical protein